MSREYVDVILEVAARDASIARVLREICALDAGMRSMALDPVSAQLTNHALASDLRACVVALRRDDVARRTAEAPPSTGRPGSRRSSDSGPSRPPPASAD